MLTATQIRMDKLNKFQDGTRSLMESIAIPDVAKALKDWVANASNPGVLIGGCAVSYHARPRCTMNIDVLFGGDHPPMVSINEKKFKRISEFVYEHVETGFAVNIICLYSVDLPSRIFDYAVATSLESDGIMIASPTALVALKLHRIEGNDIYDITNLELTKTVNLCGVVGDELIERHKEIINEYGW